MKQVLVISGKGGTGKTSLTACFATLADNAVLVDTDVDAANLHLLLDADIRQHEDFYSGFLAELGADRCNGCGICIKQCRFGAITQSNDSAIIDPLACEGCGVCADHCPQQAVRMESRLCGHQFVSHTSHGPLVHACLGPGGENSGKLVSSVRQRAKDIAREQQRELILIDGPPGIGCPVIAAAGGCDLAIVVTEPTLSGRHDLERAVELMEHFEIPVAIIVNKADLNPGQTESIQRFAEGRGFAFLAAFPYNDTFTQAQRKGRTLLDFQPDSPLAEEINAAWTHAETLLHNGEQI